MKFKFKFKLNRWTVTGEPFSAGAGTPAALLSFQTLLPPSVMCGTTADPGSGGPMSP
jgi:hypothetical protein